MQGGGAPTESANALLRTLRKRSGMSLTELAKRIDLDKGYLSRVERGLQDAPIETVRLMAEAIGAYQAESVA